MDIYSRELRRELDLEIKHNENGGVPFVFNTHEIKPLLSHIDNLESDLAKLCEQTRWRKYPDEKPEIFTDIVVRLSGGAFIVARLYYERTFWANGNVITETVIEWQPLPSAPDAKGGE
jgi:hypothetical protein